MLNLKHMRNLYSVSGQLGLDPADTLRWMWSYYGSRLSRGKTHPSRIFQIKIRHGVKATLNIRANGCDWRLVEEIFAEGGYTAEARNSKRILDLGGNIGLASVFFAKQFPEAQICCVEPIPDNLLILRKNIDDNMLDVRVIAAAVGVQDGRTQFSLSSDPRCHAASDSKVVVDPTGIKIDVDVISVPSLMRMMGWDEFDLLKIDIEGGEVEVLGGRPQWLTKVRYIIGEGHNGAGYTIDACRRDLEPMGFKVDLLKTMDGAWIFAARQISS
jgi:FkbM family methyltransferase